jgi:hypothetical protein
MPMSNAFCMIPSPLFYDKPERWRHRIAQQGCYTIRGTDKYHQRRRGAALEHAVNIAHDRKK